ncbi:MAG TPA: LLM class flavin-dependent oxidoreductase [Candidatus Limnocylindrales bacterium]|nr:LLM class flavin-dependent oxidoreductase [Candidatus Limnocylindrales bacterium]
MTAPRVAIGIKTSPQGVDWPTLDATWALAGELGVFDSAWMNDHITDQALERGGASWESFTAVTALAHRVPGLWIGHAVLSNTFRHPVVLAKQATLLDHVTAGRFILGLGTGWHVGEHLPFGIPLPPMPERFDRFESAVHVLRALFSDDATSEPGVVRPDPFYPLDGATNLPGPLTRGGPPIWLGGQKRRGIALVASVGQGWIQPAVPRFDFDYFAEKHDRILAAVAAAGRDPATFSFAAQLPTGTTAEDRRATVDAGVEFVRLGANHLLLGMAAKLGPDGLRRVADEVVAPLRDRLGR